MYHLVKNCREVDYLVNYHLLTQLIGRSCLFCSVGTSSQRSKQERRYIFDYISPKLLIENLKNNYLITIISDLPMKEVEDILSLAGLGSIHAFNLLSVLLDPNAMKNLLYGKEIEIRAELKDSRIVDKLEILWNPVCQKLEGTGNEIGNYGPNALGETHLFEDKILEAFQDASDRGIHHYYVTNAVFTTKEHLIVMQALKMISWGNCLPIYEQQIHLSPNKLEHEKALLLKGSVGQLEDNAANYATCLQVIMHLINYINDQHQYDVSLGADPITLINLMFNNEEICISSTDECYDWVKDLEECRSKQHLAATGDMYGFNRYTDLSREQIELEAFMPYFIYLNFLNEYYVKYPLLGLLKETLELSIEQYQKYWDKSLANWLEWQRVFETYTLKIVKPSGNVGADMREVRYIIKELKKSMSLAKHKILYSAAANNLYTSPAFGSIYQMLRLNKNIEMREAISPPERSFLNTIRQYHIKSSTEGCCWSPPTKKLYSKLYFYYTIQDPLILEIIALNLLISWSEEYRLGIQKKFWGYESVLTGSPNTYANLENFHRAVRYDRAIIEAYPATILSRMDSTVNSPAVSDELALIEHLIKTHRKKLEAEGILEEIVEVLKEKHQLLNSSSGAVLRHHILKNHIRTY